MFICFNTYAEELVVLDENLLKEYVNNDVPTIEKINMSYEQSLVSRKIFDENYIFNLNGSLNYYNLENITYGKENNFNYDFNISKKFIHGGNLKFGTKNTINSWEINPNYRSSIYDGSEPYINAEYSFDLWKNFLGYTELAKRSSLDYNVEEMNIKKDIETYSFFINIRKLYWSLVTNEKRIRIYEELIKQAEKNLRNTELKFKAYIASNGDVAKSKASLSSRKADLENLKSQKQNLIQQLTYLLPKLENKKIDVQTSDIENILNSLNTCHVNDNINDFTLYKKYVNKISNRIDAELKSLDRYDDIDINMVIGADINGRNDNVIKSYNNMTHIDGHNYYVGLNFTLPLGNIKDESKVQQMKLLKMQNNSLKNDINSNITSTNKNFTLILNYLNKELNASKDNIKHIKDSVAHMRKKYEQGRISLKDLIDEEDSLLQAYLNVVNIENAMINSTLDYLSVFQKSECSFNINLNLNK